MANLPRITVITPSFNQVVYLERTIRSIIDQRYPNLEYIIVDGGSTDGSIDVIRKYADQVAWWVSESDRGQVDAINKGLQRATGDWVAWQNSDDIYFPGSFHDLAKIAEKHPEAGLIIGDMMLIDSNDQPLRDIRYVKPSYESLLAEGMLLANQAAFWSRRVQKKVGMLDERYNCSFDYEWFLRLIQQSKGVHVQRIWGALRLHNETKTCLLAQRFTAENRQILAGRELPEWKRMYYKLRRFLLMIRAGQGAYVVRGGWRRLLRRMGGLA